MVQIQGFKLCSEEAYQKYVDEAKQIDDEEDAPLLSLRFRTNP